MYISIYLGKFFPLSDPVMLASASDGHAGRAGKRVCSLFFIYMYMSILFSGSKTAPYMAFFPGLLILITVISFNYLGEALRKVFEPK